MTKRFVCKPPVFANPQGTTFAGTNISASMTLNTAGLNLALSGAAGGGGAALSAAGSSQSAGTIVFSNSNGISFGMNGSTITASASGAGASASIFALGNTTAQSSSNTAALSALNFSFSGVVSGGLSGNTLVISSPGTTNFANLSVSAGTTSGSLGSIVFSNSNGVSFGLNGSTITASAAGSGGIAAAAGTQTATSGTVVYSNSNNVSFGMSNSSVITASASQVSSVGLYALGNTTQNSSTTLDQRTLSFNALGAMTAGFSNGSIQLSAPATSSLSATGQLSISTNGSTISIGVPNYGTLSYWDNGFMEGSAGQSQIGNGSLALQPVLLQEFLTATAARQYLTASWSTSSNSSYAGTISAHVGIYTNNASTLSLASSGSQSFAFTMTSNNNSSAYSGIRWLTIPINVSMTPGNYWIGMLSRTSSANANWATFSNMVQSQGAITLSGGFGSASNASNQIALGYGTWSTTSTALPASVAFTAITGSVANLAPGIQLHNVSA